MNCFAKIIVFLFNIHMIYALDCRYSVSEEQLKDAKSLYLFEVVEISNSYEKSKDTLVYALERDIVIEVVKVYKGDIEKLSVLKILHTINPCDSNNATGGPSRPCNKDDELNYPLKKSDLRLAADVDEYFYLDTSCPSVSDIKINTDVDLKSLEVKADLEAIWTRPGFKLD